MHADFHGADRRSAAGGEGGRARRLVYEGEGAHLAALPRGRCCRLPVVGAPSSPRTRRTPVAGASPRRSTACGATRAASRWALRGRIRAPGHAAGLPRRRLPHRLPRADAVRRLARRRAASRGRATFRAASTRRRYTSARWARSSRCTGSAGRDRRRARLLLRRRRRASSSASLRPPTRTCRRAQAPQFFEKQEWGGLQQLFVDAGILTARQDLGDVHPQRRARRRDPRPHRHPRHHEDRSGCCRK